MNQATDTPRIDAALSSGQGDPYFTLQQVYRESKALERELAEQKRRIEDVLDLIDGMEDASCEPGDHKFRPNLAMRVGMILRGEDRP
jgi:hypothetical protein